MVGKFIYTLREYKDFAHYGDGGFVGANFLFYDSFGNYLGENAFPKTYPCYCIKEITEGCKRDTITITIIQKEDFNTNK